MLSRREREQSVTTVGIPTCPFSRRKSVVQNDLVLSSGSSLDYLSDRLLASYFEAREHESYYKSLKHVETRRGFHETIIPVLMDFIGEALEPEHGRS